MMTDNIENPDLQQTQSGLRAGPPQTVSITMDYSNSQPSSTSINLPSIHAMDFNHHHQLHMRNSSQTPYALPPPYPATTRRLPPLPYQQYPIQGVPHSPEYVTAASSPYMDRSSGYMMPGGRMPIPPAIDTNISVIPSRTLGKSKEVKRRTKTGCMTCRKRRIKCDEGRPTCRNCNKSRRDCTGYDPVFQSPGPATQQTPTSDPPSTHENSMLHTRDYYDAVSINQAVPGPQSSYAHNSSHESTEFAYRHRDSNSVVSQYHQSYNMGSSQSATHPHFISRSMTDQRHFVPKRTIEELCCISGSRAPHVPPLPPDSTPNLESIQQVYDIAFASGLDKFLETGSLRWFVNQGFSHLVADRGLLAQFLLYLTIISNHFNPNQPENAATQSQEARITWALLNLVVKPAHDGNEEADKFSRRIKAVEALLTGEPLTIVKGSMADFIHSEDGAMDMDPAPATNKDHSSALEKQVARRSEEFWKCVEKFAEAPRPPPETVDDPNSPLNQARELLDGLENRDILYSMMLLCSSHGSDEHPGSRPVSRAGSAYGGNGNGNGHHQKEPALARRFLDSAYSDGRASNTVFATIAGLASRAFQRD